MIEIDDAICATLSADTTLVAMLGSPAISAQWPDGEGTFSDVPIGAVDYSTLSAVEPPRARVTIILLAPDEDSETPTHRDEYQIDIWSRSARLNAALARQVKEGLDRQSLTVPSYRVQETYCTYGPDLFEPDTRLHHKVLNYHVTWIGSA